MARRTRMAESERPRREHLRFPVDAPHAPCLRSEAPARPPPPMHDRKASRLQKPVRIWLHSASQSVTASRPAPAVSPGRSTEWNNLQLTDTAPKRDGIPPSQEFAPLHVSLHPASPVRRIPVLGVCPDCVPSRPSRGVLAPKFHSPPCNLPSNAKQSPYNPELTLPPGH